MDRNGGGSRRPRAPIDTANDDLDAWRRRLGRWPGREKPVTERLPLKCWKTRTVSDPREERIRNRRESARARCSPCRTPHAKNARERETDVGHSEDPKCLNGITASP